MDGVRALLGAVLLVSIIIGCILLTSFPTQPSFVDARSSSTTAQSSWRTKYANWTGDRIAGAYYFGCISRDHFEELSGYAYQGDTEAFSRALAAGLVTGACCKFEEREPVYIEDVVWTGLVQLRRPGEMIKYWTVCEAVGIGAE